MAEIVAVRYGLTEDPSLAFVRAYLTRPGAATGPSKPPADEGRGHVVRLWNAADELAHRPLRDSSPPSGLSYWIGHGCCRRTPAAASSTAFAVPVWPPRCGRPPTRRPTDRSRRSAKTRRPCSGRPARAGVRRDRGRAAELTWTTCPLGLASSSWAAASAARVWRTTWRGAVRPTS